MVALVLGFLLASPRAEAQDPGTAVTVAAADRDRWEHAVALFEAARNAEASAAFDAIVADPATVYADGARFERMKAREQLVVARFGRLSDRPDGAVEERVDTTRFGAKVHRFYVSPEQSAFVAACDDLAAHPPTDPAWAARFEGDRAALAYLPGLILFNHGRFDEARPRLEKVIADFPQRDEAQFAAGLLIQTATAEGDLDEVVRLLDRYAPPGDSRCELGCSPPFGSTDPATEAAAFVAFAKKYPDSPHRPEALSRAAALYDTLGRSAEALALWEELVETYPRDEHAKAGYIPVAEAYAARLDYDAAIAWYEQLAVTFPDYVDSPAAVYDAALLHIAAGDARGAACDFERYSRNWPDLADADAVAGRAAQAWAEAGGPPSTGPRCPAWSVRRAP
jgi:tetratricopeptide (TPR) repeat protein